MAGRKNPPAGFQNQQIGRPGPGFMPNPRIVVYRVGIAMPGNASRYANRATGDPDELLMPVHGGFHSDKEPVRLLCAEVTLVKVNLTLSI